MMLDLDTVIDRTGLQSFDLLAVRRAVPMAVTYATTFPDRVSHLILIDGWTNFADMVDSPGVQAMEALIDNDWTLFTETLARVLVGIDDPRFADLLGEHIRACAEPEAYRAFVVAEKRYDIAPLLADVRAKTLVMHNNKNTWVPIRVGQKLAAAIPDSRFLAIDDMIYERVAPLIVRFVGGTEMPERVKLGAFRTILFTDVEG